LLLIATEHDVQAEHESDEKDEVDERFLEDLQDFGC
jgi:hypothetical protein